MSSVAAKIQHLLEDSDNHVLQWPSSPTAKPIHIQQVEKAMALEPLLSYIEVLRKSKSYFNADISRENKLDTNVECIKDPDGNRSYNGVVITRAERKADKSRLYNFSRTKKTRKWLKNVLLSDTSSDEDEELFQGNSTASILIKEHLFVKECRHQFLCDKEQRHCQYYSVGLLSNCDKFCDHHKAAVGLKKRVLQEKKFERRLKKEKLKLLNELSGDLKSKHKDELLCNDIGLAANQLQQNSHSGKVSKSKNKRLSLEQFAARRRKIWLLVAKKEIPRAHRQKTCCRKELLAGIRKIAKECQKECRKSAIQSQKIMKEASTRSRRLAKEMQAYWKRFEKVEKEQRRKAEKEALEQRKIDIEMREMKRQQRKLNFLITQTELYAHFMARKLTGGTDADRDAILSSLDEDKLMARHQVDSSKLPNDEDDAYDPVKTKALALSNAHEAYKCHQNKKKNFDAEFRNRQGRICDSDSVFANPSIVANNDWPQPVMFAGKLKGYQLKGMNWLANLYDQGINGILADEMGLGKTVQSIAFLAHLVESQGIWGPFLIIAPASTLHNWQQEVTRFVPQFKVVPYWGNTHDRKTLRKFWNKKHIHMKEASFHIVITSYQLIVQDAKYFQQIEWHYMILDEAQAIKSSSSSRWKSLLMFKCRNRLLLTGTPIQNSMAELWALLHFIMPTLFDSHDEFNEWFSKDIENHVEKQSNLDKTQLGRLHMILKPFMLRRVKKDVENELSDKIEILLYCPLTVRQKMLYQAIKNKISIEDLLCSFSMTASSQTVGATTTNLMNLVMQFRKVCNHPELFERRDVKSPFRMKLPEYYVPKLMYHEGILSNENFCYSGIFLQNLFIFNPHHMHTSLFSCDSSEKRIYCKSCFSFTRFVDISPAELYCIMTNGFLVLCRFLYRQLLQSFLLFHLNLLFDDCTSPRFKDKRCILLEPHLMVFRLCFSNICELIFTKADQRTYVHTKHIIYHTFDPLYQKNTDIHPSISKVGSDIKYSSELSSYCVHHCIPTDVPSLIFYQMPKVVSGHIGCYTNDSRAERKKLLEISYLHYIGSILFSYGLHGFAMEGLDTCNKMPFISMKAPRCLDIGSMHGFSNILLPDKESLVADAGKLSVLDKLLTNLKREKHRVLIYSQMTRMIDILEEFLWYRKHTYMRLDGSSKISDRRDMVADFQTRSDIFVFLLSTRAGGLGINLTAADTVIFYDSDWNPTVDQQAMDRAHRLGQTKQVTVYRLICKGSIEERILQRAKEKSEIQHMVISGGNFAPDILKPKEVVSLLLDDDEMERKLQQKQDERRLKEEVSKGKEMQRKQNLISVKKSSRGPGRPSKKVKTEDYCASLETCIENIIVPAGDESSQLSTNSWSCPPSPHSECLSVISEATQGSQSVADDESCDGMLVVDDINDRLSIVVPSTSHEINRISGQLRGRPKVSGSTFRSRGRGSIQRSLSAAEAAAAVAAKKAAYAAYGYSFKDV